MKEINKFKNQLLGEYLEAFENAQLYYELSVTDESIMESCLNEVGDLLLNAQATERPVDKVLGKSLESFCKNLRNAYAPFGHIEKIVSTIFISVACTLGVGLYDYISSSLRNSEAYQGNLFPDLLAFFISVLLVNSILFIIKRIAYSKQKLRSKTIKFISKYYFLLYIFFAFTIVDFVPEFALELTLAHVFILLIILLALYVIIMSTLNKHSVTELCADQFSVNDAIVEQCRKDYSKANEKRLKKGKEPLTQLDMVKKFQSEAKIICNPILFVLSLGFFLFSLWLLLNYKPVLIPLITIIISSIILFFHITILTMKKDMCKIITLLEKQELKL